MSTIKQSVIVEANKQKVWEVLKDFGGVYRWHPKVETSPLHSANNEGIGAKRTCNFYDGTSVDEEVTAYKEGEYMEIILTNFSMPLKRATARVEIKELSTRRIQVDLQMSFDVKYGPVGWVMDKVMMKPMMGKMFKQVLSGLRYHINSGELVEKDGVNIPKAAFA